MCRFAEDKRVEEASHMFSTSSSVKIVVNRREEMTDAEYTDQQVLNLDININIRNTNICHLEDIFDPVKTMIYNIPFPK